MLDAPPIDPSFVALRAVGLHDDPDLVKLFDTTDPDFVAKAKAKASKPHFFNVAVKTFDGFNALTASKEEVDRRTADMDRDLYRRRIERATAREMDHLKIKYGSH